MLRVRRGRQPDAGPFEHEPTCGVADSEPEWHRDEHGRWTRVCACHVQYAEDAPADGIDPSSERARPSRRAHRHEPSCAGEAVLQVVKVERYPDGGWRSECGLCRTITYYLWTPDFKVRRGDEWVAADHDGLFWRRYELATPIVEPPPARAERAAPEPERSPLLVAGRRR